MSLLETNLAANRGFNSGNFANAYVSTDLESAWERDEDPDYKPEGEIVSGQDGKFYRAAFVVGFYSSYEDHEADSNDLEELIAACGLLGIELDPEEDL